MPERDRATVLVVDDDVSVRILAGETLREAGFVVVERGNGAEAIEAYRSTSPDLVLLDVLMPVMDGFEACREIQLLAGETPVPVIFMTSLDDLDSIKRAYDAGATDFLSKPLNSVILTERVRYMLRSAGILQSLRRSEARLANAQRIARLGNWAWSTTTDRVEGSSEFYRILGLGDRAPLSRDDFLRCAHPDDRKALSETFERGLSTGEHFELVFRVAREAHACTVNLQAEVTRSSAPGKTVVDGTLQDITELKQAEKRIEYLAYHDVLTGLPNRWLLKDHLSQALLYAKRQAANVATMFVDIDRFKRINDTLGHSVGDALLKAVAERMAEVVRDYDVLSRPVGGQAGLDLARLGGDEFILFLPNLRYTQDAARVARRLLDAIARPIRLGRQEVFVTASVGIAIYPSDGDTVELLLKHADVAMYHAKEQGRNRYQFYSESMNASSLRKLALENDLQRALERKQFTVHYQSQFDAMTGHVVGCEALLRWIRPEGGFVHPAEFLTVAEEIGILPELDLWVLEEVCAQQREWQVAGLDPVPVAVNVSNQTFWQRDLVGAFERTIRAARLPRGFIEVELTEGVFADKIAKVVETVSRLQELGVKVALDDFGTGYSSLSYLKGLPVSKLKLDRSFVQNIALDEDERALARAIIAMGHSLRKTVVAEGVETREQLEVLRAQGCDTIQGHLFGRPVPANAMALVLRDRLAVRDISETLSG